MGWSALGSAAGAGQEAFARAVRGGTENEFDGEVVMEARCRRAPVRRATLLLISIAAVHAQDRSWGFENSLLWPQEKRDIAYRNIEKIYPTHTVAAGGPVRKLDPGEPLKLSIDIDAYMREQYAAGLMVLHHGKIVLEKYARGYTAEGRWISQSMAKSVTSTLVGAAIHDGAIG